MGDAAALRAVLLHLKKQSLKLAEKGSPLGDGAMSALLLLVALGDEKPSEKQLQSIYETAESLAPADVQGALPYPTGAELTAALHLLPVPPHAVQAADPCALSFLYQFFCAPRREEAKRSLQSPNKAGGLQETISFTQLYTPTAVVDALLAPCLERDRASTQLIDPSCGAGNFLLRACDLMLESADRKTGTAEAGNFEHILQDNLYGCDIDRFGLWVTCLALAARARRHNATFDGTVNLSLVSGTAQPELGSLGRDWPKSHSLSRRYGAVVGNPPYIGRKLLSRTLKSSLKTHYPNSRQDLCAAFIERGLELLAEGGRLAYITQSSLLYLPTYGNLRKTLIDDYQIVAVSETGSQVFPLQSGEKVKSMLFVIENRKPDGKPCLFLDATKADDPCDLFNPSKAGSVSFSCRQQQFRLNRANAFTYRCPPFLADLRASCDKLAEVAEIRQGLATSDNQRFIRWWWQVAKEEIGKRWFPYVKGGGSERWYCPIETVIDWQDNGAAIKQAVAENYPYLAGKTQWVVKNERFYFVPGLTFSLVNTKQLAVRELPAGCIFDVAGSALFPALEDRNWLFAYLNSAFTAAYADILNPTINYQVGDLKQLPLLALTGKAKERLSELALSCLSLKRELNTFSETDITVTPPVLRQSIADEFQSASKNWASALKRLLACESEIDALILEQAKVQFQLSTEQQRALSTLCDGAASRRKVPQVPFVTAAEFAKLLLRLHFYHFEPGPVTAEALARTFAASLADLEATMGDTATTYLRHSFETDQKRKLHNSLRTGLHLEGATVHLAAPIAGSSAPPSYDASGR